MLKELRIFIGEIKEKTFTSEIVTEASIKRKQKEKILKTTKDKTNKLNLSLIDLVKESNVDFSKHG